MSTISPWHQSDKLNRATRSRNQLGVAAAVAVFGILGATAAAETASAQPNEPGCGFDVHGGRLHVTSLGEAKGRVVVWLNDESDGRQVRAGKFVKPEQTMSYRLKRKHTNDDFTIAIIAQNRKHNYEQVWWCESA
jgi:hypothetical protein